MFPPIGTASYMVGSMDASIQASASLSVNVGGIVGKQEGSRSLVQNRYSVVSISATSSRPCYVGSVIDLLEDTKTCDNLYTNQEKGIPLVDSGSTSKLTNTALLTEADMRTPAMVDKLGNAFTMDTDYHNQGYPILSVMAYDEGSGWSQ